MSKLVIAIDPGPVKSGWIEADNGKLITWSHSYNNKLLDTLRNGGYGDGALVIEDVSHYGPDITVGKDVFETCKWMGRFDEAYLGNAEFINRPDIKLHLLGLRRGTDSEIRQALIDKYGGNRTAIGAIKCKTCHGKGWAGRGRPMCEDCHCDTTWLQPRDPEVGCGYEVHPGPLHGVSGHVWSALAVLQTYLDLQKAETPM